MSDHVQSAPYPIIKKEPRTPLLNHENRIIVAKHKASPTCCRCGHTFRTYTERQIDVQFPATSTRPAIVTHRCANTKACVKRAKRD